MGIQTLPKLATCVFFASPEYKCCNMFPGKQHRRYSKTALLQLRPAAVHWTDSQWGFEEEERVSQPIYILLLRKACELQATEYNLNNYPSIKFRATNFVFSCFGDFSTIIICVYVFSCFRAFSAINRKEWRKRIHVTDSKYIYWQQGLTSFEDKIWTNKFVYAHRYCIIGKKFCQKSHCYPWYLIIVLILGLDEKIISSDVENYR